MSAAPHLSVVIASVNGLPYPLDCLDALAHQTTDASFEVIVADCTGPATVAAIREAHPDVRIIAHDDQRSVPALRAEGIQAARGRLVAVTEDHCVPHLDWVEAMIAAQQRTGWAAVGGGVENGSPDRLIDWAVYFCEYSSLIHPVETGPAEGLPGMNVVYDMEQLTDLRSVFGEGLWENFLHHQMVERGHAIGLDASIVVEHRKYFTVPMFLAERFHYSRAYAGKLMEDASWPARLVRAAGSAVLPPLLVARIARHVFGRRRHIGWFVRSLPLIVFFSLMWAIGEAVGCIAGPGDSLVRIK